MRVGDILYFSPERKFVDLKWDDKKNLISAFIDRVNGFYLEPAEKLNEYKKGFATGVLCATTTDFLARIAIDDVEKRIAKWLDNNIEEFREADPGNSKKTPADRFYEDFRCGLVHEGRIKEAGQFSYHFKKKLVKVEEGIIIVNPGLLLKAIKKQFRKYMSQVERDENDKLLHCYGRYYKEREYYPRTP